MKKILSCFCFMVFSLLSLTACQETTLPVATTTQEPLPTNEIHPFLDQTIYLQADLYGAVESLIAVSRIKADAPGLYVEYGAFLAAENLSGTHPILVETDRLIVPVLSASEEHYYRSTLSETYEPPVLFEFAYHKSGEAIDPINERGSSGTYALTLHVSPNPDADPVFQSGFVTSMQVTIGAEGSTIIDSSGGMVVMTGGSYTVSFMTLPGMTQDYVLSWETTRFAITSVQAILTPFDPAMLGEDLSGMADGIGVLQTGLTSLHAGMASVREGLVSIGTAVHDLQTGLASASTGLDQLAIYLEQFADALDEFHDNFMMIHTTMATLQTSGESLLLGYSGLMASIEEVVTTFSALHSDDMDLMTTLMTLSQTATAIQDALTTYISGVDQTASGIAQLATGLDTLTLSIRSLATSLTDLADGVDTIDAGLVALEIGFVDIISAYDVLLEAHSEIVGGLNESMDAIGFLLDDPITLSSFTSPDNPIPEQLQFIFSIPVFQP